MTLTYVVNVALDDGLVELSARSRNTSVLRAMASIAADIEARLEASAHRDAVTAVTISEVGTAYHPEATS